MKPIRLLFTIFFLSISIPTFAQSTEQIVDDIVAEANENSQLERLGHELLDVIGPRLVGTPEMKQAHDWAVTTFEKWGIPAENQQWGQWRGWQRGITHIDMVHPRVASLEGTQLAWSPSTDSKGVTAELVIFLQCKIWKKLNLYFKM